MEKTLNIIRTCIPRTMFAILQPIYHYSLSLCGAIYYGFPSKKIKVIGVTGTKGKSTTTEIINAILEKAGYRTTVSNTIRYKIGNVSTDNKFKMSMPGRFFAQKLIRNSVDKKCDFVILEMTSQGTIQYRHKFIELDALVFTNLSPEHIESHGSYEKYIEAKVDIVRQLSLSKKRPKILVVNGDDREAYRFLECNAEIKNSFSIKDSSYPSPLLGEFNKYNVLAGITLARALGIKEDTIKEAVANFKEIRGRVEFINCGQDFSVVVDYAHTTDSLEKFYRIFIDRPTGSRNICILGGTGGGRDTDKRAQMGRVADTYCDEIILTNEDPYDEDPDQIVSDVASGIKNKSPKIIMDRRSAIAHALHSAKTGDNVLITGKGTDPYIMGPHGTRIEWDDARVVREVAVLNTL